MRKNRNQPFISIVSPVYNGERFLSECIESVLAQTYDNWEYVIVNNCSTDATGKIAESFASKDERIHIHNNKEHLKIIQNWNHALRQISPESTYCKVLHADDLLFPECIEKMVNLAVTNADVGIVSSYRVDGKKGVHEGGLQYPSAVVSGREVCRNTLRRQYYVFGSSSTRLIRADLIRNRKAYYNENYLHADTVECYEQLQHCRFGFVHQVLSYTRRHTDSQTVSFAELYATLSLERLLMLKEFGPKYFELSEFEEVYRKEEKRYYYFLVKHFLKSYKKEIFDFHRDRLKLSGLSLSRKKLIYHFVKWLTAHPIDLRILLQQKC